MNGSEKMSDVRNVIIIGSGPAGYTAGLYTARAMLEPLMFSGYASGGQLMLTSDVENFPGYPQGITGPEMMMHLREQAERFGCEVIDKNVASVDFSSRPFKVTVENEVFESHAIIVCTGAEAIWLNAENEEAQKGRGISTCATCDGAFFRDEEVLVIGGGDSAMEEASFLTKFAKKVTIIHRREVFKASKIMLDRAKNNPLIDIIVNKSIESINGSQKDGVSSVILRDTITDQKSTFDCEGVFYGIGHNPNTELFEGVINLNDNGYIITKSDSTLTNIPGVFACGDVQDDHYRQAITAAGSGCMSAIDAEKYLEDIE